MSGLSIESSKTVCATQYSPYCERYFFFLWCLVLARSFLCLCFLIFFLLFLMTLLKKITSFIF